MKMDTIVLPPPKVFSPRTPRTSLFDPSTNTYKGISIEDHVECYKHYVFYYTGVYYEKVAPYLTSHGLRLSVKGPGIRANNLDNHCLIHTFLAKHRCRSACQAAFRELEEEDDECDAPDSSED
eukprot:TRINITY_DN11257_c0_g2_i1.p2 TRINITY_DN11257_c0_g2~~TRINITY_DN11257_c0_g2_i1.p2  ORF type:complete len:123 (-),score=27.26 TRINITY_DN11257_c0_g2_i1:68-436(-)